MELGENHEDSALARLLVHLRFPFLAVDLHFDASEIRQAPVSFMHRGA
jgi:hypothetical protein